MSGQELLNSTHEEHVGLPARQGVPFLLKVVSLVRLVELFQAPGMASPNCLNLQTFTATLGSPAGHAGEGQVKQPSDSRCRQEFGMAGDDPLPA